MLPGSNDVSGIMARRLLTVRQEDSSTLATQMMIWSGVRHLPVVDGDRLVGILSDRDLLKLGGQVGRVGDIMTAPVHTIHRRTPIEEAAARMAAERIDCLPVLDDDRLCGLVTSTDVLAERGRGRRQRSAAEGPTAEDVMEWDVVTVTPETRLLDAVETMLVNDFRHLPVVDASGRPVGMLSERDLRATAGDLRAVLDASDRRDLIERVVESVMTPNPTCVSRDADLAAVAEALVDQRIGAVLVIDEAERLVGIVSYVDVLSHVLGIA